MNTTGSGFKIIEKQLREIIIEELDKIGLLYRIFTRTKDDTSIEDKINRKEQLGEPYSKNGKKIQDVIGIRIVTYFREDIGLVKEILNRKINFISEEIDEPDLTVFKPKRTNIICEYKPDINSIFQEIKASSKNSNYLVLDNTFELQLRTMLSEGWHEIDHNLRYKCKKDWENHKESERLLNGVYASLETNDIALKNLFIELAYKHFKNENWEGLIRNKFKLKFQVLPLKEELFSILNDDHSIGKQILKIDREVFLLKILKLNFIPPININNILFLFNELELKNKHIQDITPSTIKEYCKSY